MVEEPFAAVADNSHEHHRERLLYGREFERTAVERLSLRCSLRAEVRRLFELEGFDVVGDYGDFAGGPPAYGREQVWVLTKPGS